MRFPFVLALLIGSTPHCEALPPSLDSQLLDATQRGDGKAAQALVKRGAHVNARATDGATPLMLAAQAYNSQLVDFLLQHGANIHAQDKDGFSVLGYGPSLAESLGKHGAKATIRDSGTLSDSLENSIWIDSDLEDEQVRAETKMLLRLGMNLNTRGDDTYGNTPLLNAAESRVSLIPFLLNLGADPNLADKAGRTPLMALLSPDPMWGIEKTNAAALLLLQHGAKLNNRDDFGETALIMAVQSNRSTLVRELLARGANPNIPDNRGESALMRAATGGYPEIARLLLKAGADPKLKNAKGQTALNRAQSREFVHSSMGAIARPIERPSAKPKIEPPVPTTTTKPTFWDERLGREFKRMVQGRQEVLEILEGKK